MITFSVDLQNFDIDGFIACFLLEAGKKIEIEPSETHQETMAAATASDAGLPREARSGLEAALSTTHRPL